MIAEYKDKYFYWELLKITRNFIQIYIKLI